VSAPDAPRSACGHGMTLTAPVSAVRLGERRFAVGGLPADCVYLALFGLMPRRPDVVISGVNRGPNLGTDVVYSGTVAGAREAVIRRIHGVSVSLVHTDDYAPAAKSAAEIALALAAIEGPPRLLNLNYPGPAFDGPTLAPLGERAYPEEVRASVDPRTGEARYTLGGPPVADRCVPGTDGWLISRGVASATFLGVDQTDPEAMAAASRGLLVPSIFSRTDRP
jgi:5'-nucleotidase